MPLAGAGALSGKDLHVEINEGPQQAGILVIDLFNAVGTEETSLFFFRLIVVIHSYNANKAF